MTDTVIHKQVFDLGRIPPDRAQEFEVPWSAELIAVDWDTRAQFGVALWYRFRLVNATPTTTWRLTVRGTGHPFDENYGHLGTVIRDGFAWHLLDVDGDRIPRRWLGASPSGPTA